MTDFDGPDVRPAATTTAADDAAADGGRGVRRRHGRWALLPAAAAVLALAGCSSGGTGGGAGPAAPAAAPSGSQATEASRDEGLPLEAAMRGDAESQAVFTNAVNKLAAKCARDQGYQVTERPAVTAEQILARDKAQGTSVNPYAWPSVQALKDFGYAGSAHGRDAKPPETGQPVAADSAAETAQGKCAKEVTVRLAATDSGKSSAKGRLNDLITQAGEQTEADPRMVAALAQWSQCMRPSGYTYASPLQAAQQFEKVVGAAGAQELAIARADAECRAGSRPAEVWFQVRSQLEQRLVEQNAQLLKEAADSEKRLAREASQAVAG
ncbi:hypothetical protein ACFVVL_09560 [Kitasatospora sp. NPDC058115]|uniref:hypothetical protein n=1 Tax=Kitasatospora sp. NPDC058115 TaxID=3346347 RepID=UPI0036DF01DD